MKSINRKTQNVGVHNGSRFISAESIVKLIPGIEGVKKDINQFREVAYCYNNRKRIVDSDKLYKLAPEKFNNTISILGQRGTGKTSAVMTFIEEIESGTYFDNKSEIKENVCDIITKIVDPDELGEGSDILGWVITSLDEYLDEATEMSKSYDENCKESYYYYKDCYHMKGINHSIEELKKEMSKLRISYISSKEEYANLMHARSNSLQDYTDKYIDMLNNDYDFHQKFNHMIDLIVSFKRNQNDRMGFKDTEAEPLLYFFFDDVDTSAKHCPEILIKILNFLCHPNIVVCISGNYDVFEKSMTRYNLENSCYPQMEISQNDINDAKMRAEFFLKKVLPSSYRYRIVYYTNEILCTLKYNETHDEDDNFNRDISNHIFEKLNILQLLSYDFGIGFDPNGKIGGYLESFIIPEFKGENKKADSYIYYSNNDTKEYYIYAYLAVFGKNVRSMVNVYNYLYNTAIELKRLNSTEIEKYWDTNRFSEFINILLESKYTYSLYRKEIDRFLCFKHDDFKKSSDIFNQDIRNLRIDCEELELLVKSILNDEKERKFFDEDKIGEIDSLIMLTIFINEIFYNIHRKNYEQKYKSISEKLKNILCNTFINSINNNVQILPTELDLRSTLVIYYRIISRMNYQRMSLLNNTDYLIEQDYLRAIDKTYLIQIFYATLLLTTARKKKTENNKYFNKLNELTNDTIYERYEMSTYNNFEQDFNRKIIEKKIIKMICDVFSLSDPSWFNDKRLFINNICSSYETINKYVLEKYLSKIQPYLSYYMKKSLNEVTVFIKIHKQVEDDLYIYLHEVYKLANYYLHRFKNNDISDLSVLNTIISSLQNKINNIDQSQLSSNELYNQFVWEMKNYNEGENIYNLLQKLKSQCEFIASKYVNCFRSLPESFSISQLKLGENDVQDFMNIFRNLETNEKYISIVNIDKSKIQFEKSSDYGLTTISLLNLVELYKVVREIISLYYLVVYLLEYITVKEKNNSHFFEDLRKGMDEYYAK